MNKNAEQHLTKARDYVARGEDFYRKAAEEIVAATNADPTLGQREIGEWFGRSHTWVQDIVRWHTNGKSTRGGMENAPTPYAEQSGAVAQRHARSVLRSASPEQVAEILEDPEIRRNVAKAQDLRHTEQKQRSDKAYREAIGGDVADGLDRQQALTDAEAELFKSRRALRDVLAILRTIDLTEVRESWLEEFVKTFDDIEAMLQLGRSLVDGHSVDDAIDRILEGSK